MKFSTQVHLPKKALIDLAFFCGVPLVLAVLSAALGPYAAIMGRVGATGYLLLLALVPWWLTGLATYLVSHASGRRLPLWLIAAIGAVVAGPFVSLYVYLVNWIVGDIWPALNALVPATFSAAHLKSAALSEGRAIFSGSPSSSFSMRRWAGRDSHRSRRKRVATNAFN